MTHKLKRITEVPALRIATIVILVLSLIGLGWAINSTIQPEPSKPHFVPQSLMLPRPAVTVTTPPRIIVKTIVKRVPGPVKTVYVSRSLVRTPISTPPGGVAACIRKWESGGNYSAQNPTSTASGAYQFLDSTWQSVTGLSGRAMNYSPSIQDKAFYKLWNNGRGAGQWVTSYHCT